MRQALRPTGARRAKANNRTAIGSRAWDQVFVAPTLGMVTNQPQADPEPGTALWLQNFFPTRTGIRPRGGTALHATIGTDPVTALFRYKSGSTEKLFAADEAAVYDVTAPGDPEVAPTAEFSGMTGGYWATAQISVSGGEWLIAVNGADTPREYDGSSWAASAITGSGLTTSDLTHVWVYNDRLFFVEEGSMDIWYLPVGQYTGTATKLSMQGTFDSGGSVFMGGVFGFESGDGINDYCIVISTEGQVALFQGADPASWTLVGTYRIAEPIGKNAWMRAGGDFLVATVEGIIPISAAIRKDPAALSVNAITNRIEPDWLDAVTDRRSLPFSIQRWNEGNLAIVSTPAPSEAEADISYIVNLETGAWTTYDWDSHCASTYSQRLYWGDGAGKVYEAENGGSDNGNLYTCQMGLPFYTITGVDGLKTTTLARGFFKSKTLFTSQLSVSVDYQSAFPAAPSSPSLVAVDVWDSGLWDTAIWDATLYETATTNWEHVAGKGDAFSPQLQMSFGTTFKPDVEFVKLQLEGFVGRTVQ